MAEVRLDKSFGLDRYVSCFHEGIAAPGTVRIDGKYFTDRDTEVYKQAAALDNRPTIPDTTLEFAITSYFTSTVNIRPVQAVELLPISRNSELKLAAAAYKELQEVRFLDPNNRDRIGRYEGMLKFICDTTGVSRTEVETFYRNGIRSLIAETVAEEFNKISFMMDNTTSKTSYNAVLTRNSRNQYVLEYERLGTIYTPITANSPEALSSAMSQNSDFNQNSINQVRNQATLIPAVVYADWKSKGVAGGADALALLTEVLTNFYLNPSRDAQNVILGAYARCRLSVDISSGDGKVFYDAVQAAFINVLGSLSRDLSNKMFNDMYQMPVRELARIPADPRFDIFSTRYSK